ncbi:MAG: L-threonylcarbamoyladenylate synthase [Candidatus Roizmanbacteria bacterium]|nr:L-threonylcarbamoyladenylate synthase [Candidatus Roizmanbacteria bacterium]
MLRLSLHENPEEKIIHKALDVLRAGGVTAYPTESFYGLGVNALDEDALRRLYELKKRPLDNPVPVIAGSIEVLESIVETIPHEAEDLIKRFWPGALTIVFDAVDTVPDMLTGGTGKIAVRIPGNSFALNLAKTAGFLITATSANLSGRPPAQAAEEIIDYFGREIDLIIDAGRTPGGKPSTIVDVTVTPVRVLREGSVKVKLP